LQQGTTSYNTVSDQPSSPIVYRLSLARC